MTHTGCALVTGVHTCALPIWGPSGFDYVLATFPYSYVANFGFVVVPLFMFMSQMAFVTGMSRRAFESANIMTSGLRGGLATATVFACAVFSTVSGSSIATASSIANEIGRASGRERVCQSV